MISDPGCSVYEPCDCKSSNFGEPQSHPLLGRVVISWQVCEVLRGMKCGKHVTWSFEHNKRERKGNPADCFPRERRARGECPVLCRCCAFAEERQQARVVF